MVAAKEHNAKAANTKANMTLLFFFIAFIYYKRYLTTTNHYLTTTNHYLTTGGSSKV